MSDSYVEIDGDYVNFHVGEHTLKLEPSQAKDFGIAMIVSSVQIEGHPIEVKDVERALDLLIRSKKV